LLGFPGPSGVSGEAGPPGIQGVIGGAGVAGPSGTRGAPGPSGRTGATGFTGLTGETGATGSTGLSGQAGTAGPEGAVGVRGPAGSVGLPGDTGTEIINFFFQLTDAANESVLRTSMKNIARISRKNKVTNVIVVFNSTQSSSVECSEVKCYARTQPGFYFAVGCGGGWD